VSAEHVGEDPVLTETLRDRSTPRRRPRVREGYARAQTAVTTRTTATTRAALSSAHRSPTRTISAPWALTGALAALTIACPAPRTADTAALASDAYVWNRTWTPSVSRAVAEAPRTIGALRVLVAERGATPTDVDPPLDALRAAARPLVPVLRLDTLPSADDALDATLAPLRARAEAWRRAGLVVDTVEIDHDAPARTLADYARWLARARASVRPLRLSITALPTWLDAPGLDAVLGDVDAVVVQLHAVRAPTLFDPARAADDTRRFAARAAARGVAMYVALPTYRVRPAPDVDLAAEPEAITAFLRTTRGTRGLVGVVWFRLGHDDDRDAWPAVTLDAVARGAPLVRSVDVRLEPVPGTEAADVWLVGGGNVEAEAPRQLRFDGEVDAAEPLRGYTLDGAPTRWRAGRPLRVRPGERVRVGFVRGRGLGVVAAPPQ
jgi:hypothetical protein